VRYHPFVNSAEVEQIKILRDTPVNGGVNYFASPEDGLTLDVHHELEIGVVLYGAKDVEFEGIKYAAGPGDVWLSTGWEFHVTRPLVPTCELMLFFRPDFLGDELLGDHLWLNCFSVPPHYRPRALTEATRRKVLKIALEIAPEIDPEGRSKGWTTAVRLGILRMLFFLSRDWEFPPEAAPQSGQGVNALSRVIPAIALVHSHLSRRVAVEEAAAACTLSPSRFRLLFQEAMGMNFSGFSLHARLSHIVHLLLETDRTISSIAETTGFTSASHLNIQFSKVYSCTAAEYRKCNRC